VELLVVDEHYREGVAHDSDVQLEDEGGLGLEELEVRVLEFC
jgi:hypothetical protein